MELVVAGAVVGDQLDRGGEGGDEGGVDWARQVGGDEGAVDGFEV